MLLQEVSVVAAISTKPEEDSKTSSCQFKLIFENHKV